MKLKVDTYFDFLQLSANQVRDIMENNFELYTDDELSNIDNFSSQYTNNLENLNIKNSLVIEDKFNNLINNVLSDNELLDLPAYIVLEYFRRH